MNKYLNYIKERKVLIAQIVIGLFLLYIGEIMGWPRLARQLRSDGKIGGLYEIICILIELFGLAILCFLARKKYKSRSNQANKWFVKVVLLYIVVQPAVGVVMGFISLGLGQFIMRETVEIAIYWTTGILQMLIRVTFIYIVFINYYSYKFKEQLKLLTKALLLGVIWYLSIIVIRFLPSELALRIGRSVRVIGYLVFFIIYFGANMREKAKDE